MDMPPTRFRVVERGRRLEVIDTATGQADTRRVDPHAGGTPPPGRVLRQMPVRPGRRDARWRSRAIRGDAATTFATRRFFDNKAPRRVRLDPTRPEVARVLPVAVVATIALILLVAATLAWAGGLVLVVVAAALFNPATRQRVRTGTTALIDRFTDPV